MDIMDFEITGSKHKKICLIGHEFYGNVLSGNGSFAISLTEGLLRKGYRITFITPLVEGLEQHEIIDNLEIIRIPVFTNRTLDKIIPNILDDRWMLALKLRMLKKSPKISPNLYQNFYLRKSFNQDIITKKNNL